MVPLLCNIFINDIFYFIEHGTLYNYADDNTFSYADQDYNTLINVLEKESSILIEWFNINCMQANTDKFQAMLFAIEIVNKKQYLLKNKKLFLNMNSHPIISILIYIILHRKFQI
jgi:hypothetical protein